MDSNLGRIKINRLGFVYDIESISTELLIEAEEVTKAIIKDVTTGEIKFITKKGDVK